MEFASQEHLAQALSADGEPMLRRPVRIQVTGSRAVVGVRGGVRRRRCGTLVPAPAATALVATGTAGLGAQGAAVPRQAPFRPRPGWRLVACRWRSLRGASEMALATAGTPLLRPEAGVLCTLATCLVGEGFLALLYAPPVRLRVLLLRRAGCAWLKPPPVVLNRRGGGYGRRGGYEDRGGRFEDRGGRFEERRGGGGFADRYDRDREWPARRGPPAGEVLAGLLRAGQQRLWQSVGRWCCWRGLPR